MLKLPPTDDHTHNRPRGGRGQSPFRFEDADEDCSSKSYERKGDVDVGKGTFTNSRTRQLYKVWRGCRVCLAHLRKECSWPVGGGGQKEKKRGCFGGNHEGQTRQHHFGGGERRLALA